MNRTFFGLASLFPGISTDNDRFHSRSFIDEDIARFSPGRKTLLFRKIHGFLLQAYLRPKQNMPQPRDYDRTLFSLGAVCCGMKDKRIDEQLTRRGWRKVVTGTWLYDRVVPMPVTIWAKPASQASSRYDEDDQLDENKPIPETLDGFLYVCWHFGGGEYLTVEEAKIAADKKPWGPVIWAENKDDPA